MPSLARGDDGLAEPLGTLTAAAEVAPQVVVEEALGAVTEAASGTAAEAPATPATVDDPAADEATDSPSDAVTPESTAAEDVTEPAVDAVPAPDALENGQDGVDTTPDESDIALDTPPPGPAEPVAEAPGVPVAAPSDSEGEDPTTEEAPAASEPRAAAHVQANVNVSVRIGSPGDDGPVTQVNVVSGGSQPTRAGETAAQPPARDAAPAEPTDTGADGTWYWDWDCLGLGSMGAISPFDSTNGSVPSSWTWIWNCGDNSSQYQGETDPAYRQGNTNVSIRFSSPGDNGSVAQVNVGAAVRVSVPAPTVPRLPALPSVPAVELPQPAAPTVPAPVAGPVGASIGVGLTLPLAGADGDITLPSPVGAPPVEAPSDDLAEAIPSTDTSPRTAQVWPAAVDLPFGAGFRARPRTTATTATPFEERAVGHVSGGVGATAPAGARAEGHAPGAVSRAKPRAASTKKRIAPRWRPAPLPGSDPVRISTASAAAAGGGGSSGSGIPFLLALPFVAALLDLARRVALEHATWPTGHRRRAPDRPG